MHRTLLVAALLAVASPALANPGGAVPGGAPSIGDGAHGTPLPGSPCELQVTPLTETTLTYCGPRGAARALERWAGQIEAVTGLTLDPAVAGQPCDLRVQNAGSGNVGRSLLGSLGVQPLHRACRYLRGQTILAGGNARVLGALDKAALAEAYPPPAE